LTSAGVGAAHLSLSWDEAHKTVNADWTGFFNTVEFRDAATKLVEEIKARRAISSVCDIQKLEVVIRTDQLWIRDTWVPMALASGLKRIGVVVALHGVAKFAADAMIRLVGRTGIETRLFNSFDDARNWLDEEDKKAEAPL
jgi:hypothetical protein